MKVTLRMTEAQHAALYRELFRGDGNEAVVLGLGGQSTWTDESGERRVVCVHELHPMPEHLYTERTPDRVAWSTDSVPELLTNAARRNQLFLKIHSHPTGYPSFSEVDDVSDRGLFQGAGSWLDTEYPGLSAVMLPDGSMFARAVSDTGHFITVDRIAVVGHDIQFWDAKQEDEARFVVTGLSHRTAQVFGKATTQLLATLRVGVVGTSGTGSPVIEQVFRLGVGELVLVDPQVIEEGNVGRIYNSTIYDAHAERNKVDILADAVERSGLPTRVIRIPFDIFNRDVVLQLAQCDVVIGCMDSVDGRDLLNRLATFYSIPYLDLGVRIDADGIGGVEQVSGALHYMRPDGLTLLERRVYSAEELEAAALRRDHPGLYEERRREGYIAGIDEDRPAVISVNSLVASLAANELLARLHPYRDGPNSDVSTIRFSLTQSRVLYEPDLEVGGRLLRFVGRGDCEPLLQMPALSA